MLNNVHTRSVHRHSMSLYHIMDDVVSYCFMWASVEAQRMVLAAMATLSRLGPSVKACRGLASPDTKALPEESDGTRNRFRLVG